MDLDSEILNSSNKLFPNFEDFYVNDVRFHSSCRADTNSTDRLYHLI